MRRPRRPEPEKRRSLLIDDFMARGESLLVHRNTIEQVRSRLRAARKFVLDDEAVQHYANVIETIPDLIARHQQFARAPYDVTWIEFNFEKFWEQINKRDAEKTADQRIGFLIDHGRAYVVSGRFDGHCTLSPFGYDLHTPWLFEDQLEYSQTLGTSRMMLDAFMWGSAYNRLQEEERRALRDMHRCFLLPSRINDPQLFERIVQMAARENIGDIRNIITILLLLNRPSLTRYVRTLPTHRGFIGNKLRTYFDHTVVTISLDPKPTLRLLGTTQGEGVERRRHEVRGHWVHDRIARDYAVIAGCIHEWRVDPHPDDDPADPDHWKCSICDGKRWWRTEHVRGSSLVGFVKKQYNVTD